MGPSAVTPDDLFDPRRAKLAKFFRQVIAGEHTLKAARDGDLFIEAVCSQPDPPACINKLASTPTGLLALQTSLRFRVSPSFLNGPAARLLTYFQDPALKVICEGDLVRQIVLHVVEPPIFWNPLVQAFGDDALESAAQQAFAWLLLELVAFPDNSTDYHSLALDPLIQDRLLNSPEFAIRTIGHKIKHVLSCLDSSIPLHESFVPGGRHDNDFADFRKIAILPSADELTSTERPFLRLATAVENIESKDARLAVYIDNHFRLLREDMLGEIRDELQIALGIKKGRHRGIIAEGFSVVGIHCGTPTRFHPWAIRLAYHFDLRRLLRIKDKLRDRKAYLKDNKNGFKHHSLACLVIDDEIVAFPTVNRDEVGLAADPPTVVLQFAGEASTARALLRLKTGRKIKLVQIDTAVFAFEPVLRRLQQLREIPLEEELVAWDRGRLLRQPTAMPMKIIDTIAADPCQDLQPLLQTPNSITLDESQSECLVMGLTQRVSLIQGPPGTGKSFIGALIAKTLHDFTTKTMLVVCYTNHALDQFLEDLLDIGIPQDSMVRLGGKATPRTSALSLYDQSSNFKMKQEDWNMINGQKAVAMAMKEDLQDAFGVYKQAHFSKAQLLEHLEFDDPVSYEAFVLLDDSDGDMEYVGRKGKAMDRFYLLDRWRAGKDAGIFKDQIAGESRSLWDLSPKARRSKSDRWVVEIYESLASGIYNQGQRYNDTVRALDRKYCAKNAHVISKKRIIACTTTAAAKYGPDIQAASPNVLLVEEAGEILESHILTAMGARTDQLILIGDHQQLRPKVNNYALSVEKGEGYDLNRSLFERLVLKGYPHQTLAKQYRMRPEISALVRRLTYPNLKDAAKTQNREDLRGFKSNLIFVHHTNLEDENDTVTTSSGSSKQNLYEAEMILKCVKYLGQNGYGSDSIVVLTPYLAQLYLLKRVLSRENDPVLNDLDSHDLVKAGLISPAAAKLTKNPIRISSVDNYQGEESRIVLVTMTRSNASHEIGFMAAPERLNVLLSRARDALIMIGNAQTFINARNGSVKWRQFFDLLREGGNIYEGVPVKCERHPSRTALLKSPADFDNECRDGGCSESCGVVLSCGIHSCPQRCHQLYDHSKMQCHHVLTSKCAKGHATQRRCFRGPPQACARCDLDDRDDSRKQQRDFELQQKRAEEQREHARQMSCIDEKIEHERQRLRDEQLRRGRDQALQQKTQDLLQAARMGSNLASSFIPAPDPPSLGVTRSSASSEAKPATATKPSQQEENSPKAGPSLPPPDCSPSVQEWERRKQVENASNDAIEAIMGMTGLEEVKAQVLKIMAKIETMNRQGTDMKDERVGVVLLGNPGSGKTTIARLYAKFLTSIGVLPGAEFFETTGSRLANDGVAGAKKHIEGLQNAGGGAFFVDEAYQLTGQQNYGGGQVLDFLLAEIENNIGTIVFIVAGYNKQMEKFFEHNPGLSSRLPYVLRFADYTDSELHQMLRSMISKKYGGKMKVQDGVDGLFMRIVITRLGRGRGSEGFGNARALQNVLSKIAERQGERLGRERRKGLTPDDFYLTKEDVIGPDPSDAAVESAAWGKLQQMIGLDSVKESVKNMIDRIASNHQRELEEQRPIEISLNRIFFGSPGTGKTSVAKLYGQILADLGLLSSGEVVTKNPADFIGGALGQSENQTKSILAATVGKVLIIDEAYMLYSGAGGTGNQSDSYKTAVIDTLVAEVQSVPGEDRCVLLLGYKEQIEEMFQNVNPGLARRFAIDDAFHFQDFTSSELEQVLERKLRDQDLSATDEAKQVAIEVLGRARRRPNFGNAGEVENLLSKAKDRYQSRQSSLPPSMRTVDVIFEPRDFDAEYDRGLQATMNCSELFKDVIGCRDLIEKLEGYQQISRRTKALGMEPHELIPTNFVFKGPPGTGKTTTARKMGQVFYDMGFLSVPEVVECSATDIIGQYVGQTAPKTQQRLEKGLGKVLFIDEAYRLGEGHFGSEAVNELVDQLTKPKFAGKLVVILAGYDEDMNRLLAVNPGLSSRFPEEVNFQGLTPESSLRLLDQELRRKNILMPILQDCGSALYLEICALFTQLSMLPQWGNARDIQTLAKSMIRAAFQNANDDSTDSSLSLSPTQMLSCIRSMLESRLSRQGDLATHSGRPSDPLTDLVQRANDIPLRPAPKATTTTTTKMTEAKAPAGIESEPIESVPACDARDAGVSDSDWNQLQADRAAAEMAQREEAEAMEALEKEVREAEAFEARQAAIAEELAQAKARDDAHMRELMREREAARLREQEARRAREQAQREQEAAREAQLRPRQEEQKAQAKLRDMGVCCAGYRWTKQDDGYRCGGGYHFVSDAQLGM